MWTIATTDKWTIDRYHQAIASGIFDGQNKDLQITVFQDHSPLGYRTVTNLQDGKISPLAFSGISIEVRHFFQINHSS